jgi:hypothetical protein
MSIRLSTGLRNALLAKRPSVIYSETAATFAIAGGTPDKIHRSAGTFVTYYQIGDIVHVSGFTSAENNGIFTVSAVAAADLSLVETAPTTEAEGDSVTVTIIRGGSWEDLFWDGILDIYTGAIPADADATEGAGSKLVAVTIGSVAFALGTGLKFDVAAAGVLAKRTGDVWSGVGLVNPGPGTAAWFRFYDKNHTTGASPTAIRFDGTCGTSGADLLMSSTSVALGATVTIDAFNVTLPAA